MPSNIAFASQAFPSRASNSLLLSKAVNTGGGGNGGGAIEIDEYEAWLEGAI